MQIKAVSALGGKTKPNSMSLLEMFVGSYAESRSDRRGPWILYTHFRITQLPTVLCSHRGLSIGRINQVVATLSIMTMSMLSIKSSKMRTLSSIVANSTIRDSFLPSSI
jgi:hypothetical protein